MRNFLETSAAKLISRAEGEGRYACVFDKDWWIVSGPNGGILAAMVARALMQEVNDATRPLRTLTLYYLARPLEGEGIITTKLMRRGRNMSFYKAQIEQDGRLLVEAIAAFGGVRDGSPSFSHVAMPKVPPPEQIEVMAGPLPIHQHYEMRWHWGGFFIGGAKTETGGWFRLKHNRASVDLPLIAAASDGWLPAVFTRFRLEEREILARGAPTIELTISFLHALPHADISADEYLLLYFNANEASEGYLIEDGEIWSQSGLLLARSRQLALI